MAEVKNAFIKSKMNKDLDDRLIPSGEYREGINIQVSKSEGADVGALENVLGNEIALDSSLPPNNVDFNILSNCECELKSIGTYVDNSNSIIYIFLTDYTDNSIGNFTYNNSANNFIYSYNTNTRQVIKLIEGPFLNFSTKSPIYGVNLLENLLFWTDNRNQPRKLNINLTNNGLFYTTEDKISVAKYNPYECINLYYEDIAALTPIGDANPNENKFVTSMQDVTSEFLPDVTTKNPYYNPLWPGDPDFLEDKFVRFSYRFKFVDGEYSILAPFTQDCFIPKQDGYFIADDESAAYRSTIVQFMENKVNNIILNIPLPYTVATLYDNLNIEEIDIVYKESDGLAVKVLDTIIRSEFQGENNPPSTDLYYNYDYQSRKPYRTLPDSEITRVYDKVPVRAFSQEMISNRVVYGNFQTKHTPPVSLNYDVAVSPKLAFRGPENGSGINPALWYTSITEYPEHTVKQNRNYQIGFVLADRYGRSSTTILSSVNDTVTTSSGLVFGGSTYYHPYRKSTDINSAVWPGDSIKVLLNKRVESFQNLRQGTPGLYNGDITSDKYNPLGWYSYKIVVKQTEQDYYNAYLPGILNGYPSSAAVTDPFPTNEDNKTAHIVLLNDNINKIPRDLSEVGPDQKQYRSSVQLYGRVDNNTATTNVQYYPGIETDTVSTIANAKDLDMFIEDDIPNATSGLNAEGQANLYQIATNPMIGRVSTPTVIGTLNAVGATNMLPGLAVYETKSTDSLLDIFWETSTSGTINDLNLSLGTIAQIDDIVDWNFTQTEASVPGNSISGNFYPVRVIGQINPTPIADSSIDTWIVIDGKGTDVTDYWTLETLNTGQWTSYILKPNKTLYFNTDEDENEFTFTFNVTDKTQATPYPTFEMQQVGTLTNIAPTITTTPLTKTVARGTLDLITFTAVNGCANADFKNNDLEWNLVKAALDSNPGVKLTSTEISLNSTSGELTQNGALEGPITCTINVTDSGNAQDTVTFNLLVGVEPLNLGFGKSTQLGLAQDPVTVSTGAQSASIYWQNGDIIPTQTPLPNNFTSSIPFNDPWNKGGVDWTTTNLYDKLTVTTTAVANNNDTTLSVNALSRSVVGGTFVNNDETHTITIGATAATSITFEPALTAIIESGTDVVIVDDSYSFGVDSTQAMFLTPTPNEVGKFPISDPEYYKFKNILYRPNYFNTWDTTTIVPSGLTTGTAFIVVECEVIQQPYVNGSTPTETNNRISPTTGWPVYLQYRENASSDWETAVDVEGSQIRFGGSSYSQYNITPSSTTPNVEPKYKEYKNEGIIQNATDGLPSLNQDNFGISADVMALRVDQPFPITIPDPSLKKGTKTSTSPLISGKIQKTFVFGKDQGYEINNKLGEYRLFIIYPYSTNGTIALGDGNRLSTSNNYSQTFPITKESENWELPGDENIKVSVAFGDFYYFLNQQNTAFKYRVSEYSSLYRNTAKEYEFKINKPSGSTQTDQPVTYYAAEWACKYVTKFYEDEKMTQVAFKNDRGYRAYASFGDGSTTSKYGTNYSAFKQGLENPSIDDSRWTMYIKDDGTKEMGSSQPNTE
jgi:hypothetical protein